MEKSLEGKVALVTGGSRGIGRAISIALASQGAHVYVNYGANSAAAEATVALCEEQGGTASILGFNVADSEKVDEAFATIKKEKGQIDILVNNAGVTNDGLFVRTSNDDWQKVLDVNLNGSFYCARAAAKLMMRARKGTIINISSVVGQMGNPGQASYVASKAAINGLTKSLAKELAARNITVNAITPGFIETDMTDELNEQQREDTLKAVPLGRLGRPEEIASLAAFLSSDGAAYITGQVLSVNGGMYM